MSPVFVDSDSRPVGRDVVDHVARLNKWREQYNPLRGLTIARAVSYLEAAQRGEFADLQWTYFFVEQTDPDLFALVERRPAAIVEMDYDIKVKTSTRRGKALDEKLANEQADALDALYEGIDNLYQAIEHLAMASFRGYAHLQKQNLIDQSPRVTHLEPLDQWNAVRDGLYGAWKYNPEAKQVGFASLPAAAVLNPAEWLIRDCRRHINRIGLLKFIRANMSQKDWDAFCEVFGFNQAFVIEPENVDPTQRADFMTAAERAAAGGGGSFPYGTEVRFPNAQRGSVPFEAHLIWLQKQLVLAGTGGMLTMLTESGSGTLAGGAHSETFKTIAAAEARKISALFQEQLEGPYLSALFPNQPHLAYFDLAANEERDPGDVIDHNSKLAAAGVRIKLEELQERTGYALEPIPGYKGPAGQPTGMIQNKALDNPKAGQLLAKARRLYAGGRQADFAALAKRINGLYARLPAMTDEDAVKELDSLRADLLDYLPEDPATAKVIADTMAAQFANGIQESVAPEVGA